MNDHHWPSYWRGIAEGVLIGVALASAAALHWLVR